MKTRHQLADDLYREHHDRLVRMLGRRFLASPAEAIEDGVQFAWQQFLAQPATWQPRDEAFPWLYVVAYREILRGVQRVDARSAPLEHVAEPGVEYDVDADLDSQIAVREIARHLTNRQLQALGYRALGFSYGEISAATGWTPRTVERQIMHGRARARAAVMA